jgi:hypothetical protein
LESVEAGGRVTRGLGFVLVDDLGVHVAPSLGPVGDEKLGSLVKFLARVLESLERAGARDVRLQLDWDGGMVVVKRRSDGAVYGVYAAKG